MTDQDLFFPLGAFPDDDVLQKAKAVKLLILDVDGVLTDGCLLYDASGESNKSFYVQDGLGIQMIRKQGIRIAIISGRHSKVTASRAQELGFEYVIQGAQDKGRALRELLESAQVDVSQCGYMGDDVIDLPILRVAGLAMSVANAHPLAKQAAHWVSHCNGGKGAVREACEMILFAQSKLALAFEPYLSSAIAPDLDIV